MNLLDRIASALGDSKRKINFAHFEECATDFLQTRYPHLVPIRGGSDSGRDADILAEEGTPPVRMAITSSRTYKGARANLKSAMESLKAHEMPGRTIVSVSLAELNQSDRKKLEDFAKKEGFTLEAIIDRAFFGDRLRRSGDWRKKLLDLPGGPFSLSKVSARANPSDAGYELIGREDALESLKAIATDTIIYGSPGVGKSTLLERVPGCYFVDGNPAIANLMDDILETDPAFLVVDDAPRRLTVLRDLQHIRRQEELPFRIIAVCWPHERESLATELEDSDQLELLPLIRADIARIAESRGITRESALAIILDQARGRPAWAVRLIELLKSEAEWKTVHTGEALRGEVWSYLHRSDLSKDAREVLSIIALMGSIAESDISELAKQIEISRSTIVRNINDLAVGGLLDVRQQASYSRYENMENVYSVAPEILASSIIVDAFFGKDAAILPVSEVFKSWPDRQETIALNCVRAALLGASTAVPVALSLFSAVLANDGVRIGSDLLGHYLYLGPDQAKEAISLAIEQCAEIDDEQRTTAPIEILSTYVANAIRHLRLIEITDSALTFSVDLDRTQRASFLAHIVSTIRNAYIADGSLDLETLFALWKRAQDWYTSSTDSTRADVIVSLLVELMKPAFDSASLNPTDGRMLRLFGVVLPAEDMNDVIEKFWDQFESMELDLSRPLLRLLTDHVATWAHLSRGFSLHGVSVTEDQKEIARQFALRGFEYVIAHAAEFPSIRYAVRRHGHGLGIAGVEEDSLLAAVFFVSDDDEDWQQRMSKHESLLRAEVETFPVEPGECVGRLAWLKQEMIDTDQPMFNPLHTLFRLIAQSDRPLLPWLLDCQKRELFPEAGPLVSATLAQSEVASEILTALLDDPQTRAFVVDYALRSGPSYNYFKTVLDGLGADDLHNAFFNVSAGGLEESIAVALLQLSDLAVRSSTAAAILLSSVGTEPPVPDGLIAPWEAALAELPLPLSIGRSEGGYFLERLLEAAPSSYEQLLVRAVGLGVDQEFYKAVQAFQDTAPNLAAEAKTRIFAACDQGVAQRRHVFTTLRGADVQWMEAMLDSGAVDADFVDSCFNGFGATVPIDDLARLLVPRGIDPERVAMMSETGSYFGDAHERLSAVLERMRDYAKSDDPSVSAVGRAGVRRYEPQLIEAQRVHRDNQVRGRW